MTGFVRQNMPVQPSAEASTVYVCKGPSASTAVLSPVDAIVARVGSERTRKCDGENEKENKREQRAAKNKKREKRARSEQKKERQETG